MTRNELIETLANYFNLIDTLECDDNGNYDIHNEYEWTSGCSFGNWDTPWLTLENVVDALECLCDDEDDDDEEDW